MFYFRKYYSFTSDFVETVPVKLSQSRKIDTKNIFSYFIFSKVDIHHILGRLFFSKVDMTCIFCYFSFFKVDTLSAWACLRRILDQIIVSFRCIDAALVCVQDNRLGMSFQQFFYILPPVDILVSVTFSCSGSVSEYFFREYIEVESDFKVKYPEFKRCHIGYDHLSGTIDGVPGRKDQIRICVFYFSLPVMYLMLRFCFDSQIAKAFVYKVIAALISILLTNICCSPPISMGSMLCRNGIYQC